VPWLFSMARVFFGTARTLHGSKELLPHSPDSEGRAIAVGRMRGTRRETQLGKLGGETVLSHVDTTRPNAIIVFWDRGYLADGFSDGLATFPPLHETRPCDRLV
jgi:hypothetical protein